MEAKKGIINNVSNNFGKKVITTSEELLNSDSLKGDVEADLKAEQKRSEKNNGALNTQEIQHPSYRAQKLSAEVRDEILANYEEFRKNLESSEEYKQIQDKQKKEGYSGDEPFICFAEMDSTGKMRSTIIITKDSVNRTTKQEDGTYLYEEHRKNGNGYSSAITRGENSFYISSKSQISRECIERAEQIISTTKNFATMARKMDPQTLLAYQQTLQSLKLDNKDINFSNGDRYTNSATGAYNMNEFDIMTWVIDKESDSKQPIAVSLASEKDGKITSRRFRFAGDGQYIDESSFKIKNGQPYYKLVTLEQIKQLAAQKGIDVEYFDRLDTHLSEGKPLIPQIAKDVNSDLEKESQRAPGNINTDMTRD